MSKESAKKELAIRAKQARIVMDPAIRTKLTALRAHTQLRAEDGNWQVHVITWLNAFVKAACANCTCSMEQFCAAEKVSNNAFVPFGLRGKFQDPELQAIQEKFWPRQELRQEMAEIAQDAAVTAIAMTHGFSRRYLEESPGLYRILYVHEETHQPLLGTNVKVHRNISIPENQQADPAWKAFVSQTG